MTSANLDSALDLLGINDVEYPSSTSWGNSLSFIFLDSVPNYYPAGYVLGFVGHDEQGVAHPLDEPGLFSPLDSTQKDWVRTFANGDPANEITGFNNFTSSTLYEVSQTTQNDLTFGRLNYNAQPNSGDTILN